MTRDSDLRERLERLEALLSRERDGIDAPTIRLMLEDYASVVSQLRASVRTAERQLSSVAATVADGDRIVGEERTRPPRRTRAVDGGNA